MQTLPPDNREVLEEYVWLVGGPTALANKTFKSFHAVFKWRRAGEVTDSKAAILFAEALGVQVPPELRRIAGLPPYPEGGQPSAAPAPEASEERTAEDDQGDDDLPPVAVSARWSSRRRVYAAPTARPRPIQGILCGPDDGASKVARYVTAGWCPPGDEAETA